MNYTNCSVDQQIVRLILTILPVMGAIIVILIVTLLSINSRYTSVPMSANTAADFNKEFKVMLAGTGRVQPCHPALQCLHGG